MTDPWLAESSNIENKDLERQEQTVLEFEDNFTHRQQNNNHSRETLNGFGSRNISGIEPLPDSDTYLQGLERKLRKLKKDSRLVEALAEKREDCLRNLLEGVERSASLSDNAQLELDTPIRNGESTVQEIFRHLQPIQAATVGETVHIVQYDQLEQQRKENEEVDEERGKEE